MDLLFLKEDEIDKDLSSVLLEKLFELQDKIWEYWYEKYKLILLELLRKYAVHPTVYKNIIKLREDINIATKEYHHGYDIVEENGNIASVVE